MELEAHRRYRKFYYVDGFLGTLRYAIFGKIYDQFLIGSCTLAIQAISFSQGNKDFYGKDDHAALDSFRGLEDNEIQRYTIKKFYTRLFENCIV